MGALVVAVGLAYSNSLRGPFVLDDALNIERNTSILDLGRWRQVLWPVGPPTSGRPLLNLSFALNHAWGGMRVEGYHAFNLAVHLAVTLLLFELVRRAATMRGSLAREPREDAAVWAFGVALLWALHPLDTASITYVSQRAEALMAACYLATLYGVLRSAQSPDSNGWRIFTVLVCAAGMATKEVMVTAPVVALLYDAVFIAGTIRAAWQARRGLYLGLAGTWVFLVALMLASHIQHRGVATGAHYTAWSYACTECVVILRYLKLTVWPSPLVFDYGVESVPALSKVVLCGGVLVLIGLAGVIGLKRKAAVGFFLCAFFILLAPTSSVVPVEYQPSAENRVYLPLLAVLLAVGWGLVQVIGRRVTWIFLGIVPAFVLLTHARNALYADALSLWTDTVALRPENTRARNQLGAALATAGRLDEAIAQYDQTLLLDPRLSDVAINRAYALLKLPGRRDEAIDSLKQLARTYPDPMIEVGLGNAYRDIAGSEDLALAHYAAAARLATDPSTVAAADYFRGQVLATMPGRFAEAVDAYRRSVEKEPTNFQVQFGLAEALARTPEGLAEARLHYEEAVRLRPDFALAHNNLGAVLLRLGQRNEAIAHYRRAVDLRPDFALAQNNLGTALAELPNGVAQALPHFAAAVRVEPGFADAQLNLGRALLSTPGRQIEAISHLQETLKLDPSSAMARYWLARAYLQTSGREAQAVVLLEEALRLDPDFALAREALARVRSNPVR